MEHFTFINMESVRGPIYHLLTNIQSTGVLDVFYKSIEKYKRMGILIKDKIQIIEPEVIAQFNQIYKHAKSNY